MVEGGRNEHFRQLHVHFAREGKASRRSNENITRQKLHDISKCVASSTGGRKVKRPNKRAKLKACLHCQLLTGVPDQLDAQVFVRPARETMRTRNCQVPRRGPTIFACLHPLIACFLMSDRNIGSRRQGKTIRVWFQAGHHDEKHYKCRTAEVTICIILERTARPPPTVIVLLEPCC